MRLHRLAGARALAAGTAAALAVGVAGAWFVHATAAAAEWTAAEKAVLSSMRLAQLPPPPHDPSNAVETVPAAAVLGERLFSDTRFSRDQTVSCATCHLPQRQFQDGLPVARGVGTGARRTMPLAAAAHSPWLFWDGRKDSLWSQALGPLEDAAEHGSNRMRIAALLRSHHASGYAAVFGPLPDLAGLPQDASPLGNAAEQAAWNAMDPARRMQVDRVFANLGKAIAAYERTLVPSAGRFDRYVDALVAGDPAGQQALTPMELRGLRLFIGKAQCATCHNGPLLTDRHFHNTGVPPRDPARPDRGRAAATGPVQRDPFNCLGAFSDAAPGRCEELRFMATDDPALEGAFKTPSLRNVAERAPYMHAGQFASLHDVLRHYTRSPAAATGRSELVREGDRHALRQPIRLSEAEMQEIVAFLRTL